MSLLLRMKEFILPSRRKNWADPSVSSRCRADRRYTTVPGVASGPTAARYGLGNMVHCRPAWLGVVRVNLHRYHSSPARREKSDYLLGHNSTVSVVDRGDLATFPYICGAPLNGEGAKREVRQLRQNKTTKRLEDHSMRSPFAQSKIHTNSHVCTCESGGCFVSLPIMFGLKQRLRSLLFSHRFFFGRKEAEQEWKLDFRETKGGRKKWR